MAHPVRKPKTAQLPSAAPAVNNGAERDIYDEIADERDFPQQDGLDTRFVIRVGAASTPSAPSSSRLVLLLAPLIRLSSRVY